MNNKLKKIILIALFLGMLCHLACLDPIDNSFDKSGSGHKILVINEIVANSSDSDNDWIELYNAGEYPVYLKDYSIVDDNIDRDPFTLPDITLEPGDFFVLLATEEAPEDDSYYVPFRLGNDDSLILYWGLAIVDVLDWDVGQAPQGYSYGRFPDGIGMPSTLMPTPYTINKEILKLALIINEIVASGVDGESDWIELYVFSDDPVYLGDYSIVDDNIEREPIKLPDITVDPGEFIVILATDEEPEDGSYYVPFRLGADDSVILYKDSNIVDVLDWIDGDAPSGYSYGRFPDGSKEVQTLIPTPGQANESVDF